MPATQTLAQLDPHTFAIEIPYYSQLTLQASIDAETDSRPAEVLGHELTHWYDIVGSVWGQKYISELFCAYDAIYGASDQLVDAFPEALRLFDTERRILFPSYYKYYRPKAVPQKGPGDWQISYSTGLNVMPDGSSPEGKPILFVRLRDGKGEVARQPLTPGALLELRALAAELGAFTHLRSSLPPDELRLEYIIFQRRMLEILYHPAFTTYSAGAHVVANATGISDVGTALLDGSTMADICLNLSGNLFRGLKETPNLSAAGRRRVAGFKSIGDVGFAFAVLAFRKGLFLKARSEGEKLDFLQSCGLPPLDEIYEQAKRSIRKSASVRLRDPRLAEIRLTLANAGVVLAEEKRKCVGLIPPAAWQGLPGPLVMSGDATFFQVGQACLGLDDIAYLQECSFALRGFTRQALRAGRGMDFGFDDYVY